MKCHPYLWLAPHLLLPLAPCLNPQSACYIYIVMRAPLLTKHFLFDCTHKKKSLQIALANSSGKFQQIFLACSSLDSWWCRLYYSTSNLKDFSSLLSPSHCRCFCLCPFVFFFLFPDPSLDSRHRKIYDKNYWNYLTQINSCVTDGNGKKCFVYLFVVLKTIDTEPTHARANMVVMISDWHLSEHGKALKCAKVVN